MEINGIYTPQFQQIRYPLGGGLFFEIHLLREDLAHGYYQGNKWWKLKNNLAEAQKEGHKTLLTFGGAYSNHIHAMAAAGLAFGIQTIGIIRGEIPASLSPTLQFAKQCGMQLHFESREAYREKNTEEFIRTLQHKFGSFYLIPEGGSNKKGLEGCKEWGKFLYQKADIFCLAAGTGTTAAGIALANPEAQVWAFSALKNGGFLKEEAEHLAGISIPNLQIITEYSFGGYAKFTPLLVTFIEQTKKEFGIPLEQVYTAKALYGLIEMARQNRIHAGKKVCFIHTGGMQGRISVK